MKLRSRRWVFALAVTLQIGVPAPGRAGEYLTMREVAAIGGVSAVAAGIGLWAADFDSTRTSRIDGPFWFDESWQRRLARDYVPGRTNFLSGTKGGLATPAVAGAALVVTNLLWPRDEKWKDASQDAFLFASGLLANLGVNEAVKGLTARPRPYVTLDAEAGYVRADADYAEQHGSFYSGHTSGAFFAATYLNHRVRSVMRDRLDDATYRRWRWAPPAVLFGWATFVGWSRVDAWEHYPTDVMAGAAAGWLMGELYYTLGNRGGESASPLSIRSFPLQISYRF